jgi:hypothetical protein
MKNISDIQNLYDKYKNNLGNIITFKNSKVIVKKKFLTKATSLFFSMCMNLIGIFILSIAIEFYNSQNYISMSGAIVFSFFIIYIALESVYKSFSYYSFNLKKGKVIKKFIEKEISSKNFNDISLIINQNEYVNYIPTSKNYILHFNDNSNYEIISFGSKKALSEFSEIILEIIEVYNQKIKSDYSNDIYLDEKNFYLNKNNNIKEDREITYYKSNIKSSTSSNISVFLISIILSSILGIIYSFINYKFHVLFIIIMLPILLGSSIGIITSYFMRAFGSNNMSNALKISIISSLTSIYFSWITFFTFNKINLLILSPFELFNTIIQYSSYVKQYAVFFDISGKYLFLLWILESITIFYYSYSRTKIEMSKNILCNDCNKWLQKIELRFDNIEKNHLKESLEKGDFSILNTMSNLQKYLRLNIYTCPNCKNYSILDACHISSQESGAKIAGYINKDIDGLIIQPNEVEEIINIYNRSYNLKQ